MHKKPNYTLLEQYSFQRSLAAN